MIDFKEVAIDDKDIFEKHYREYGSDVSEMTFTNVFMWRKAFGYKYTVINGLLCCISHSGDTEPFALLPAGSFSQNNFSRDKFRKVILDIKEYFEENNLKLVFKRVSKRGTDIFKECFEDNEIEVVFNRDDSDYVYKIESLAYLKGKKYHKKRNHVRKFMRLYGDSYEYVKLSEKHIDESYRIMEEWCSKRNCNEHRIFGCERLANIEVLKNFEKLNCKGALIKVNGRFEAVTVGEQLSNNTVVIHIEKGNSEIEGIYNVINKEFCQYEWNHLEFSNREQDLGVPGLRKAKLSYHPDKMIDKYIVRVL